MSSLSKEFIFVREKFAEMDVGHAILPLVIWESLDDVTTLPAAYRLKRM